MSLESILSLSVRNHLDTADAVLTASHGPTSPSPPLPALKETALLLAPSVTTLRHDYLGEPSCCITLWRYL